MFSNCSSRGSEQMESGVQSPNSSEEVVVAADPLNVISMMEEEEDIKPDISNIDVSLSNISNVTENIKYDITIKGENLDEQEHSWPTASIRLEEKIESSYTYFGDLKMEPSINKSPHNNPSKLSSHSKPHESSSIKFENVEDLDNEESSSTRKVESNEGIKAHENQYNCDEYYKNDPSRHQRVHTDVRPYICLVCDKKFKQKGHLADHLKIHTGEKPFNCDVCNKTFSLKQHMNSHKKIHTSEKPFNCTICDKKFHTKTEVRKHIRIHTGEKPFSCDICKKTFSHSTNMNIHKRIHTGEKPFSCDICYKTFSVESNMYTHKRVHSGEKPFSCDICNKTFSHKSSVNIHKRNHTGEKPFSCDICNKTFSVESNMNTHRRIHTGEKPFECEVCHREFSDKSYFNRHKIIHDSTQ